MEPTTVGSLWLENETNENLLEIWNHINSYMGRSKNLAPLFRKGFAEIREIRNQYPSLAVMSDVTRP